MRLKSGFMKRAAALATALVLSGSLVMTSAASALAAEAAPVPDIILSEAFVQPLADHPVDENLENVALGKPVTASGVSDGNKDNVVDGSTDTKWDSEFLKHPDPNVAVAEDAWLCVDLGATDYQISRVTVKFFNKIYSTNYKVQVSDTGNADDWRTVAELAHPDGDESLLHLVEPVTLPQPTTGRYVRLLFHSVNNAAAGNGVGVTEFEVYGKRMGSDPEPDPDPDPNPNPDPDQPNPDPDQPNPNPNPDGTYAIYPIPQSVSYPGGSFTLGDTVSVSFGEGVDTPTQNYLNELLGNYGLKVVEPAAAAPETVRILLDVNGKAGAVQDYLTEKNIITAAGLFNKPDAYLLDARDNTIVIQGSDADSVFFGVATLKMMFHSVGAKVFQNVHIEDYASVPVRGYIEGFYGNWGVKEREDLMRFARDYKMNSYVYAAKGDQYHTNYDQMYPAEKLEEFRRLVEVGEETKVHFAWSVHLGSFFNGLNDGNRDARYQVLLQKIDQLVGVGVKRIDVLNDDFGGGSHDVVMSVLNQLNADLKARGCEALTYCPQGYNKAWSGNGAELEAMKKLDPDIAIYWTGDDVNWPLTQETLDFVRTRSGHAPDFWMNYPVNEHAASGIFLGDITYYARDNVTGLAGFHSNPSRFAYANQVALYQLAALNWNNTNFTQHAEEIWLSAFDYLQPEVRDAYRTIARNISNAPNSSRVPGFHESEYLAAKLDAVAAKVKAGDSLVGNADAEALINEFSKMNASVNQFRADCANKALVAELDPWLSSLQDMARAGKGALESLMALGRNDPSAAWLALSDAAKAYDTRYSHPIPGGNKFAMAGSLRLNPFVGTVLTAAKNQLNPILNPYDETVNPTIYAMMGGRVQSDDANARKMYDGDPGTVAGWNIVQEKGDYFGLDLGRVVPVHDVTILQGNSDTHHDVFHKAVLQVSEDGKIWTNVPATVTGNTVSAEGLDVRGRYVRYYLTETGFGSKPDFWTYVREFTVNRTEPERDRVYTNVPALSNTPLTLSADGVSLRGLTNVTLQPGQYVGISLVNPRIVTDFVNETTGGTGLALEWSYNGSIWTPAGQLDAPVGARLLRLINPTQTAQTVTIENIGMNVRNLRANPVLVSSTMPLAAGDVKNLFDGELSTGITTRDNQANNQDMVFDLGDVTEIHDITTVTTDGAQRFYDAKVQISMDRAKWQDVVTIANDNSVFEVPYRYAEGNANGAKARYLRVLITGNPGQKLVLNEIRINADVAQEDVASPIVTTLTGNQAAAADNNIMTLLAGKAQAGDYLEYRLQQPVDIKQISVIQGAAPSGRLFAIMADGTRRDLGLMTESVTVKKDSTLNGMVAVRIEWDAPADVALYEVCIAGTQKASDDVGQYVDPEYADDEVITPTTNLALNKKVTVSGTSDGSKEGAVDGNPDTKWDSDFLKGPSAHEDAWLSVDLGNPYTVNTVKVMFFNKIYPTSYEVQVSDDGTQYTTVKTLTHPSNDNSLLNLIEEIEIPAGTHGRHVRLLFHSVNEGAAGNGVGVKEIEIYGKKYTEPEKPDEAVTNVIAMIDALGTIDLSKEPAVEAARAAFDKLIPAQQKKVTNLDKLTAAETALSTMFEVQGASLSVSGDIAINFHIKMSKALGKYAAAQIKVGERKFQFMPLAPVAPDSNIYVCKVAVSVRQMTDTIKLDICKSGRPVGEPIVFSVRDYAEKVLTDKQQPEKVKAFVRAMLYHGAAMQKYKNYNMDKLATNGMDGLAEVEAAAAQVKAADLPRASRTGSVTGLDLYGANLSLMNDTTLSIIFDPAPGYDEKDYTYTIGDMQISSWEWDRFRTIRMHVSAQHLDELITLQVQHGAETMSVTYSPLSYARSVLENSKANPALQEVARSLVVYNATANALVQEAK